MSPFSDFVVTVEDEKDIYDNINAIDKKRIRVIGPHLGLADQNLVKRFIRKTVNDEEFTFWDNLFVVEVD